MNKPLFAAALAAAVLLSACQQSPAPENQAVDLEATKKVRIGLINQTLASLFAAQVGNGAQRAADELGVELVQLDSQSDEQRMASQVQDLIAQQVDGILLMPINPNTSKALVDSANNANIPIAATHNFVGASPDELVEGLAFALLEDERGSSKKAAEMAIEALPDGGKVGIILGMAGYSENEYRVNEFKKAIENNGKFEIVGEQAGDWTKEKGQAACQNLLAANPDIALFYAIADDMAGGCVQAVKAANSKAKVIGVGGQAIVIDEIRDGNALGTVCYKPENEGYEALKALYDVVTTGKNPEQRTIYYETPAITAANVDQCDPQW
ncbi:MAG: sugar ABC transporter substrate-binding protein [Propionibacteriaceae bacterium]|jgi:ribose transport system substrate-binding protein|nr:sugar ABC transporter substrate-binding protein [Propionibacteriaceae bacterium]